MIKLVMKFGTLKRAEQWLFIQVFCLTGAVRLAILLFPFRWLAPALGKYMQESSLQETSIKLEEAKGIGRVVETVSRYTPWESKCLVQAIVGKVLLRKRGIANTLYLGVGRDEFKILVAHAWLRCGETILTGAQRRHRFSIVGKFFDDGEYKKSREGR